MKLLYSGASPFVRKVMIVAHKKGVIDLIELMPVQVNPLQPSEITLAINPLGKIPALALGDGSVLYGATVVAEYLDQLVGSPTFFPTDSSRWTALRRNALSDGILEAAQAYRVEGLRPIERQWPSFRDVQALKIKSGLDAAEREASCFALEAFTIAEVAFISALGWLDLRLPDLAWREGHPALSEWFERASLDAEVIKTAPILPM